ncbi:hypothetical protein [Pyxidicoccus xibeiensis]|uniref:hypothetical protein n=1 Tax=Pyxidicoccus xibeiensis TaxID=2906759 RepID=UPI0020A7CD89|nr:hypothetical protein [Pyxidicoccus xibeiensis]MCP3144096.1 hypothetical protein [Pyxidicoccus xibeiensis]
MTTREQELEGACMETEERVKKEDPARTQPIRDWWTAFGYPGRFGVRGPFEPRTPPPDAPPPPAESPSPEDPVARGVEQGYRVIEEYLRQGQEAARKVWAPYLGGMPREDELQQRMSLMFQSASDFARVWLELMGGAARPSAAPRPPASGAAGPFVVGAAPARAPPPEAPSPPVASTAPTPAPVATPGTFTVELESGPRFEVSVELRPRAAGLPLRVHALCATGPDAPPLTHVSLEWIPDEARVVVRLRIPEGHPPGTYSGVVVDARTGLPQGTVYVRLAPR